MTVSHHMATNTNSLLSKINQVGDTEHFQPWTYSVLTKDLWRLSFILPLLHPSTKIWNCKAKQRPRWDRSQTKPLRNSHPGQHVTRVWSRLVSSPWVPGTTWEILVPGLLSGTPPMPHWGWRHNRKNYSLYECLSPSVYYENHCAPTSPWESENRPEQSVNHYPGKPIMTTSSSIWLSVGRVMAQRETETVGKK